MWPDLPPDVLPEMLHADFWLGRVPNPDAPILVPEQRAAFDAHVAERIGVPPVWTLSDEVSAEQVRDELARYAPLQTPRYGYDGRLVSADAFRAQLARAVPELPARVRVRFGLTCGERMCVLGRAGGCSRPSRSRML